MWTEKIFESYTSVPLANMQPTEHGWKEDNGAFLPLVYWQSLPNVLSETMDPTVSDGKDDDDDCNQNVPSIRLFCFVFNQ